MSRQKLDDRPGGVYDDDSDLRMPRDPTLPTDEELEEMYAREADPDSIPEAEKLRNKEEDASSPQSDSSRTKEDDASKEEADKLNDQIGGGFRQEEDKKKDKKGGMPGPTSFFRKRRNQYIGAGAAVVLYILIGLFFGGLQTLKLQTMVAIIQDKAFASLNDMSKNAARSLFSHYITKQLMPGMVENGCLSTAVRVDRHCAKVANAQTPAGLLFNTWRDARIENILYEQHGIEIIRNGNSFQLRAPGIDLTDISDLYDSDEDLYSFRGSRSFRAAVDRALDQSTSRHQFLFRFEARRTAEHAGARACLIACSIRDSDRATKIRQDIENKKLALASWFMERFVEQRSAGTALFFNCLLASFDCTTDVPADETGRRLTQFDKDFGANLQTLRGKIGSDKFDVIAERAKAIRERGPLLYVIEKLTNETVAKIAGKAIPFIGWADLAYQVGMAGLKAGVGLHALIYTMNSQYAQVAWAMVATAVSEQKADVTSTEMLGEVTKLTEANPNGSNGTADATASPLYQAMAYKDSANLAMSLFPKAYAQQAVNPTTKLCNDGYPQLDNGFCSEYDSGGNTWLTKLVEVGGANPLTQEAYMKIAGLPNVQALDLFFKFYNGIVPFIFKITGVEWVLGHFSEYLEPYIAPYLSALKGLMVPDLLPNLVEEISGNRFGDVMIKGALHNSAETALNNWHGRALSFGELAAMYEEQESDAKYALAQMSWWDRMFDRSNPNTMISQLAVAAPGSITGMSNSFLASFSLGNFANLVPNLLSRNVSASASVADIAKMMNITMYGLPASDPFWTEYRINPIATWAKYNCDDPAVAQRWGDAKVRNPTTGQYEALTADYCGIMQRGPSIVGGKYNTDLMTVDQLQGPNAVGASLDTGVVPGGPCSTVQECADRMLNGPAKGNITYWTNKGVDTRSVVEALSRGEQAYTTCPNAQRRLTGMNINILKFILEVAESGKPITVNALTDKCHSDGSLHYTGNAVDLEDNQPWSLYEATAKKYGGQRNSETTHYHISFIRVIGA